MNKIRNFFKTLSLFIVLVSDVNCRKYDIEEESLKLYGEDFNSVLKRFRRTPDYLKILNDKMGDLKAHLKDVGLQTLYYYNHKLSKKIEEMFAQGDHETTNSLPPESISYMRSPFSEPISHFSPNSIYETIHQLGKLRPHRQGEGDTVAPNPVETLDKYPKLTSTLTLQERNMFRDMGFEFAGQIVHSIIKSMGNEDSYDKSTRLPMGDDRKTTSTTEHYHELKITGDIDSTKAEVVGADDTFKFKYRAPRISRIKS